MSDTGMFSGGPDGRLRLAGWRIQLPGWRVKVALARSDDSDPVEVLQDVDSLVRKIDAAEKNS